ncbi:MAG: hypothetical protein ABR501_02710 [Pyrinomonadaceae bacterium]
MSKRISLFLIFLTGLPVPIVLLSERPFSQASVTQRASVATSASRNAAIIATTAAVLKDTSAIRQLRILRSVRSGAQSRVEIERMLIKNLDEQMTATEMHATELSLRKFGLAPLDFEFRPFIIRLLTEQVAGYYDPRARQFHLADWLELEGQKPVMAHELTHALQDQHFNLRRFEKWPHGDSDAELAAHALIEGDATLAMTIYMRENPLVALAFTRSIMSSGISSAQFNQAPRALRESLIFPYLQGLQWSTQLHQRGGWSAVSKAFHKLPQSSEQILHVEKYFAYEAPVKVMLPDLERMLGTGWRRLEYDVNGEWSYYLILDQFLNSQPESKRAAAGWGGDRYALYEGPNHQVLLTQLTSWDTDSEAREFFDAYAKRTELRYPSATDMPAPARSKGPLSDRRRSWRTNEGEVVMEQRGPRVLILEGIPQGINSEALIKAIAK